MKAKKQTRRLSRNGKKTARVPQRFVHLRDIVLPILEPYGVKRVALFGSVVRGEDTPESDVDLLVKFKKPIGLLNVVGVEMELSKQLKRKVDLVTEGALSKYIRPYVEKEKVILYER
ncbi:MAG: nucleotidyltransferase family protein [Chloroflexi bacterium]|nr:nucleotidyltransferase family protein [Chloroflexota bacterium]